MTEYVNSFIDTVQGAKTTFVKTFERLKFKIRDTSLCTGSVLLISPKTKTPYYLWSTGETTDQIKIEKANTYWIKCYNKGCSYTDTFKVRSLAGSIPNFGKEFIASFIDNLIYSDEKVLRQYFEKIDLDKNGKISKLE